MKTLQSLVNDKLLEESTIIPTPKKGEITLYDIIKDSIKSIVYKRKMGYTHYVDMDAVKTFLKDNKVDKKDLFVTTKGKKPTAPGPLCELFVILTKCIIINPDEHPDVEEIKKQMQDILKDAGIKIYVGGGWDLRYYGRGYKSGAKKFGGTYNYLSFEFGVNSGTTCTMNFDENTEIKDIFDQGNPSRSSNIYK